MLKHEEEKSLASELIMQLQLPYFSAHLTHSSMSPLYEI